MKRSVLATLCMNSLSPLLSLVAVRGTEDRLQRWTVQLTPLATRSTSTRMPCLTYSDVVLLATQDAIYGVDDLHEVMRQSDYVIACVPHTPQTHEMINAAAIAAMKINCVFVNIGRGKSVEEPALIEGGEGRRRHILLTWPWRTLVTCLNLSFDQELEVTLLLFL